MMTMITDTYAQKNLSYLVYDQLTLAGPVTLVAMPLPPKKNYENSL